LDNIIYKIINGNFDIDNMLFFIITLRLQFLLSFINLFILFTNSKNYYYLGKILFYVPQLISIVILIMFDGYWKENIFTIYIPFFVIQTFFYFEIKKRFYNSN
jgi:hypothetical protein